MAVSAQVQVIQKYIAAYDACDVGGMLKLLSRELRFENWSGIHLTAEASGIDEFRRLAEQAKTMFSEREQRVTALKQGRDSIIVSIVYHGQLDLNGESEFAFNGCLISKIVDQS